MRLPTTLLYRIRPRPRSTLPLSCPRARSVSGLERPSRPSFSPTRTPQSSNRPPGSKTRPRAPNAAFPAVKPSGSSTDLSQYYNQPDTESSRPFHHLHVFSTKHNTHLTLTDPKRNALISVSCGNMGYRKAARGTYEAAFHMGAYLMGRIQNQKLLGRIENVELCFRGWGSGREAISKILLGVEGQPLRGLVRRVVDKTRIKIKGGQRAPKPRRLG